MWFSRSTLGNDIRVRFEGNAQWVLFCRVQNKFLSSCHHTKAQAAITSKEYVHGKAQSIVHRMWKSGWMENMSDLNVGIFVEIVDKGGENDLQTFFLKF